MNASQADFAATAPWKGIIGRPVGTAAAPFLIWDATANDWAPITLAQLKALLDALP